MEEDIAVAPYPTNERDFGTSRPQANIHPPLPGFEEPKPKPKQAILDDDENEVRTLVPTTLLVRRPTANAPPAKKQKLSNNANSSLAQGNEPKSSSELESTYQTFLDSMKDLI